MMKSSDHDFSPAETARMFGADDEAGSSVDFESQLLGAGSQAIESELAPNIPPSLVRPTAGQLAAGIAKAGAEGRIPAWSGKNLKRYFDPTEQSDGSFLTCCPAHNDLNPSFVASDGVDDHGKPKLLIYCRAGCGQDKLIDTLDKLGLWNCAPNAIDALQATISINTAEPPKKTFKNKCIAIVPVPSSVPPPPDDHFQLGPITKLWEYLNEAGQLVFYVCRIDLNPTWQSNFASAPKGKIEEPKRKTFRPLSFCKCEDGTTRWNWAAPASDVPFYRADKLAADLTAKVIICEGEKAADAAQLLLPNSLPITWHGGASTVHKAGWTALANRKVLIWPDHDDAGSKAADKIVTQLRLTGCANVSVIDARALAAVDPRDPDGPKREPPPKWDAADALVEWTNLERFAEEINRASRDLQERIRIEVSPDNIGETIDKAEKVVLKSHLPIFKRAGFIVRAGQYEEMLAYGQKQSILAAHSLNAAGLGEVLESAICFEQYDARRKATKSVHAPELVLKTFAARGNMSGLKPLTGLSDIPLIRRDGTLLDAPGYDEATGMFYQPSGLVLDICKTPSLDDAREALDTIQHLIRDFMFQTDADKAAAISAFISAVNRPTLGATPMHAFSAPTPASGKSLLATVVTIIATGSLPSFITQGPNDEELEKRISSQMLAGRQVINLDNCNRPVKGAALCNLLTAERVSLRILGQSNMPEIASSSFILANGNNVRLADDMVRRTVISLIDTKLERPEERAIGWDAKAEARENRGKYVSACLTIMLAYQAAGAPKQTTPLGSFEYWSRHVRDAIVWVGMPDPCANSEKLREADPELERFLNVVGQWQAHFSNQWVKVADVIEKANEHSELKLALMNVADVGRDISANRLAAFLSRYADRPLSGFKFVNRNGHAGTKQWRLEKARHDSVIAA